MECVLKNKRHEEFCWILAAGRMDPVAAFRKAGYKGGLGWLWRLLNREDIGRRLREIGGLLRRLLIAPVAEAVESLKENAVAAAATVKAAVRAVVVKAESRKASVTKVMPSTLLQSAALPPVAAPVPVTPPMDRRRAKKLKRKAEARRQSEAACFGG
ncbi:MAG: hypothetical protein LBR29_06055 [Methylobacteriaceae bacterium]|jgi:hypothetical protein|nr:hypothetical protein [Methylobacteriaceae bacterium]